MSLFVIQILLGVLVFYQIQIIHTKSDCKAHYSGVCVSKSEKCPFANGTEVKSIVGRRDLCHDSNKQRRCCVPPAKPRVDRKSNVCGQRQMSKSRIVGGHPSRLGQWPWQVSILNSSRLHHCGGSIIDREWILTAAHCVVKHQTFTIVAGDILKNYSGKYNQIIPVKKVYLHKLYRVGDGYGPNDVALLKLEHKVELGPHVSTVCLPNVEEDFENMFCTVTGYGELIESKLEAEVLHEVDLPILTAAKCAKMHKKLHYEITYEHICAAFQVGERSACLGDSGGPLVCSKSNLQNINQFVQAGIVLGGYSCGGAGSASIFTRVTKYLEWIEFITKLPFFDGSYANDPQKEYIYKNVTLVPV